MKKIKRLTIVLMVLLICVFSFTVVLANADDITVKYKDNNGVQSVDIIELAKAMKVNVNKNGKDISMVINTKKLAFNEENSYVYVDGKIITLSYTKETSDDKEYKLPSLSKITKDGDGYLFPVEFVEEYLGISGGDDSIVIKGSIVSKTPEVTTQTNKEENVSSTDNSRENTTSSVNNRNNSSSHNNHLRNPSNSSHSSNASNDSINSSEQNSNNEDNGVSINPSDNGTSNGATNNQPNNGEPSNGDNGDNRHEDNQTGEE